MQQVFLGSKSISISSSMQDFSDEDWTDGEYFEVKPSLSFAIIKFLLSVVEVSQCDSDLVDYDVI